MLVNPYMWLCECVALIPARGSVWPRCCWGSWVLWPAGGWTGVLPGGPVDTRNKDNTAVSTTHTKHLCTLLVFPQNHRRDSLSTARWAPPVCQPECVWGPSCTEPERGLAFSSDWKCNSVTLPHPFFLSLTLPQIICPLCCLLQCLSHIMWWRFATLWTDDSSIFF